MAIITRLFFRGTDDVIVRRAPKDHVYLVEAINLTFFGNDNNVVYILDRHMKVGASPILGLIGTNFTPTLLAIFGNEADGGQPKTQWVGQINQRTKYISVGFETSQSVPFGAIVYGQIVRESKSNLLWEFITKRHR